jgi:hypothetical protein
VRREHDDFLTVPMSSVELSRDIAHLISRVRNGEAIDTASQGEELAARYPDLGMSGELIGKAIVRAAGMLGLEMNGSAVADGSRAAPREASGNVVEPFFRKKRRRVGIRSAGIPRRTRRKRFFSA